MKQIKKISASGLARVMSGCLGALTHDNEKIDQSNAAAEGDAFHELLVQYVRVVGERTSVASNGVPFDDDMHFYAKQLRHHIPLSADNELVCSWQTRSGIQISGRFDWSFEVEDGKELFIVDIKYGWGIVDPENNWQLLSYAIGEVIRRQKAYSKITLCIMQPRPHHERGSVRKWEITYEELLNYMEQINQVTDKIASGDTSLITGSHCKYCPAAATSCVAINRATYNSIDVALNHAVQDSMDNNEVSLMLSNIERAVEILKIKQDALGELAKTRLNGGQVIPNYFLKPSYTDRKWNPGVTPESIKMMCGVDITEVTTLTPAKAEKKGVPKELMKQFAKSEIKGMNLVRGDAVNEANKIFNNKGGQ